MDGNVMIRDKKLSRLGLNWVVCVSISFLLTALPGRANGHSTEVRISLLGQPCSLQGPFEENILKLIHSVGPAQIYPILNFKNISSSLAQAKKSLEKIHSISGLPTSLDRYREKLKKRLGAQVAFMTALLETQKNSKKSDQNSVLLKTVDDYLQDRDLKKFESILRKNHTLEKMGPLSPDTIEALFEYFNDSIEPDPEAEFHRAIKKLGVQYVCSFEENEDSSSK
jgi:hypothetical protein